MQKLTARLKLTDEQVPKVQAIMEAKRAEVAEFRAKYKGQPVTPESKAAMEKAQRDFHADTDAKLAQVLTPSQMTEYKKMRHEHMKKDWSKGEKEEKGEKNEKNEKGEK